MSADVTLTAITLFITVASVIAWIRWLRYKEATRLAELGHVPAEPSVGAATLRWGLILSGLGLALTIGLYPLSVSIFANVPLGLGPLMLVGLLPLFLGLALITYWRIVRRAERHSGSGTADGWPAGDTAVAPDASTGHGELDDPMTSDAADPSA